MKKNLSRRSFLGLIGAGTGAGLAGSAWGFRFLEPIDVKDPLRVYPDREWEQIYRDLYAYDSSFVFLCAPNDTHNCLLRAYVRSGVVVRIGPTYGYGKATDADGGRATHRWDPRCCQKGLAMVRRIYGDRRCKVPMVRTGWLEWARAGFPRDPATGAVDPKYLRRGHEPFVRVSWEDACDLVAQGLISVASTYDGADGARRLEAQGYDPAMIEATGGAGVQTIKMRGGMPLLGITRIVALPRLANTLALLDDHLRKVGPNEAMGARIWDSYTWHTDLPPGHPMVTGQQTVEFDLALVERSNVAVVWGMNWIATKMPDAHWLTEARLKGTKVVVIACEYSATMNKADYGLVVRPGTTPALALGLCHVILEEGLHDQDYLRAYTDLPSLVRMDTLERLEAKDVAGLRADLRRVAATVVPTGGTAPSPVTQSDNVIPEALAGHFGPFVVWDERRGAPAAVNRDEIGRRWRARGVHAALEGTFQVRLADGSEVECRPAFDLLRSYVADNFDPASVEQMTWAPTEGIREIARLIAANPEKTLFACGMGPNQFFNNDLKDRAIFFLASLTRNVGFVGGNVGSYAGNYRLAHFTGMSQYAAEDPFDLELDPAKPARSRSRVKYESLHYWNSGDRVLRKGKALLTGKSHLPTPTKAAWVSNSNSWLGNAKGHYDQVVNSLPKLDMVVVNDWWWTGSCEYADVVFAVDSWAELKFPDATASITNPFLQMFPRTPLGRLHRTRSDIEAASGVGEALARHTGDDRFAKAWHFVSTGEVEVYLQRIFDASNNARGVDAREAEKKAAAGVPTLMLSRTYPRLVGWEQAYEDKPWYTRTGRVELYRGEREFRDSGENLPVHREPIDSTFYEPNVIVAKPHPAIRPMSPEDYGASSADLSTDARQARHVIKAWADVRTTKHPLTAQDPGFRYIFHTPKYRHGAHTTGADTDVVSVWFGPFGDNLRRDRRTPYVTEGYVDIHPEDARALGCDDGDYIYVDADPEDRPFRGWQDKPEDHKVARLLCRARFYPGTPRGVLRMWYNMGGASHGTVRGQANDPRGLARNQHTGYASLFRFGSHQSCTRAWLKPTLMTETLIRKNTFTQQIGIGFEPDVHCPTGAPREAFVRVQRAEAGGLDGEGRWRPGDQGTTPGSESDAMLRYLSGGFAAIDGKKR